MLSKIRERASGWIAWFIVILISIPFALWGINSYFEGLNQVNVAEVNGTEIDAQTYQNTLSRERQRLVQQLGSSFDPALLEQLGVKQRVMDGLISETLLRQYVDGEGYRVSDEQLRSEIARTPAFQQDGAFSEDVYRAVLNSNGYSAEGYEAAQRQSGAIEQLQRAFTQSAIVPEPELERLLALELQQRKADYAVIETSRFLADIQLAEDAIKNEYEQHADRYQAPARIKVEYLQLTVEELSQGFEPTEEELEQTYQQLKGRYREPESRRASHILLPLKPAADPAQKEAVREQAEDILNKAQAGGDFSELAKEHSQDPGSKANGGDLGFITRGQMAEPFEEAVFAMQEEEVRGPVETRFGFHVIKLTELKPGQERPFEAVREEISDLLKRQRAEEEFADLGENFRNLVFENPEDLQVAADELGLKVTTSDWFTRDAGDGVATHANVRVAAFGEEVVDEGLNSQVIEADPETLVAVRKLEYQEAHPKPLDEVRAEIEQNLKQEQARREASVTGEAALSKLRAGEVAWQTVFSGFE
ncbi:MAG: SurA N-terminal domain-containing protein, partial [Pseudomonadota bacterium]|nr:SurA N-terminal domain-containing protein [Pseudomonadota bacterium]